MVERNHARESRASWHLVALAVVLAGALALPVAPGAEPAKPDPTLSLPAEDVAAWVTRLETARTNLQRTRSKLAADEVALARARSRRYPRGESLAALERSVEQRRKDLAEAEAEWPTLLEDARRAGVPPGALRAFQSDD